MVEMEQLGERLLARAAIAFPLIELPPPERLVLDLGYPGENECVRKDLLDLEGKEPSARDVRGYAQEWYHFQPDAWKWALARYIPLCVLDDATSDLYATTFLIYALDASRHSQSHQNEAAALLSTFSVEQIECLMDFVGWAATTTVIHQNFSEIAGALACLGRARAAKISSQNGSA